MYDWHRRRLAQRRCCGRLELAATTRDQPVKPIEVEIDYRRRIKRKRLAHDQPANNGIAQRLAQFRPGAMSDNKWDASEQRGHCSHHDRSETQQACAADCGHWRKTQLTLANKSEINKHNAVLFDDADKENDPDQCNKREVEAEAPQHGERAKPGRRQRRQNGDGGRQALREHAEDDVDDGERRDDEIWLGGEGRLKGLRIALKTREQRARLVERLLYIADRGYRGAPRLDGRQNLR